MDYKRFASHGHDNPASHDSIKRMVRSYPMKRKTWGMKKKEMAKKMNHGKHESQLSKYGPLTKHVSPELDKKLKKDFPANA